MRYLLSVAGGTLVGLLDPGAVEVWRMRALARTFRYGVAFAWEKAVQAPQQGEAGEGHSTASNPVPRTDYPRGGTILMTPLWTRLGMSCQTLSKESLCLKFSCFR